MFLSRKDVGFHQCLFCTEWGGHVVFLSFILWTWCIISTDFLTLNHSCIPRINPLWSWCIIFLLTCWIWIADTVHPHYSWSLHLQICWVAKIYLLTPKWVLKHFDSRLWTSSSHLTRTFLAKVALGEHCLVSALTQRNQVGRSRGSAAWCKELWPWARPGHWVPTLAPVGGAVSGGSSGAPEPFSLL